MNAQETVKIKKETKNKIKVDFERASLSERMKAKFINLAFIGNIVWYIFRLILLIGIAYIVLFPFYSKIAGSFMYYTDFVDVTVRLIPKTPTLLTYKLIIIENQYWEAFKNTFILSFSSAVLQMFVCCLIGYGLAKFRFKGAGLVFACVILTMVIPHQTLQFSLFMAFRYFDILGIFKVLLGKGTVGNLILIVSAAGALIAGLVNTKKQNKGLKILTGVLFGIAVVDWIYIYVFDLGTTFLDKSLFTYSETVIDSIVDGIKATGTETAYDTSEIVQSMFNEGTLNFNNSFKPLIVLSMTGLGFKNGLYIFLLRQFFMGVPDELEESAYIDGSNTIRTFLQIILPLSIPTMITVFIFAFSWQWTDDFYTTLFFTSSKSTLLMPEIVDIPQTLKQLTTGFAGLNMFESAVRNTCGLLIMLPLLILYLCLQNFLVQGIERSGITG